MKKIVDIINYIEAHLSEDISVEGLAEIAGYSRFHLQRLFRHCVGINLSYYINQRRLMEAAKLLANTDDRIIEISMEAGFKSQEAFTRAFKGLFKKTPAQYRKQHLEPVLKYFSAFDKELVRHLSNHPELSKPRFAKKGRLTLMGFQADLNREDDCAPIVEELWRKLEKYSDDIPSKHNQCKEGEFLYGVLRDGASYEDANGYRHFSYCACAEVSEGDSVPEGMTKFHIEPQNYVVFEHRGGMASLPMTNKYIWGVWFSQNHIRTTNSPDFELYSPFFAPGDHEYVELWIPIIQN